MNYIQEYAPCHDVLGRPWNPLLHLCRVNVTIICGYQTHATGGACVHMHT